MSASLLQPSVVAAIDDLVSWMVARSDPGPDYGQIVAYQFPSGQNVDGPEQVFSRINQDPRFSSERTLLGQGGSQVEFGDFLVIPVGNSLLYVQPVYVSSAANAIPELKRVLVVNGGQIGIGSTLQAALDETLGGQVVPPPDGGGGGGGTGGGTTDERVRALLQEAVSHFDAANAALRAGDLDWNTWLAPHRGRRTDARPAGPEDEALIRMDLVELLGECGYVVVGQAADGQAAVEQARALRLRGLEQLQ